MQSPSFAGYSWDREEEVSYNETFKPFPKIPRLVRPVIITEKIDGTNSSVVIDDEGRLVAVASRNRWITPGKSTDNYGFADYAYRNHEMFEQLGPGHHFGEWWGVSIARGYGLAERRFSLFNRSRWNAETLPIGLHVVPVLGTSEGSIIDIAGRIDAVIARLMVDGSVAAPGYENPEGIVVFHVHANQMFKYTLDGDGHKGA